MRCTANDESVQAPQQSSEARYNDTHDKNGQFSGLNYT